MSFVEGREALVAVARAAEEQGYESVGVSDHVAMPVGPRTPYPYSDMGMKASRPMSVADAIVSLAVVAGCTERVKLATGVLVLPYRNPILTAKMLATLDNLSAGRLVLGVGAGWLEDEFEALQAPSFKLRGKVVEEWIRIFRTCWSSDQPSYAGPLYSFPPVHFSPRPIGPVPILVGGNSAAALRRAGTVGDGWWATSVTPDEARRAIATIRGHAEAVGRDPEALFFGVSCMLDFCEAGTIDERHLIGTPEQVAERIYAFGEAGLGSVELRLGPLRDPEAPSLAGALELVRRFTAEVRPLIG